MDVTGIRFDLIQVSQTYSKNLETLSSLPQGRYLKLLLAAIQLPALSSVALFSGAVVTPTSAGLTTRS